MLLDGCLAVWCAFAYWQIHHRRLDYSWDRSFLGFPTAPGGVVNEASRVHVALGVVAGALRLASGAHTAHAAHALVALYTLRNFKHARSLNRRCDKRGVARPGLLRSSMARQQLQLHLGVGVGGATVQAAQALGLLGASAQQQQQQQQVDCALLVVCLCSLALGAAQLSLGPVGERERREDRKLINENSSIARRGASLGSPDPPLEPSCETLCLN